MAEPFEMTAGDERAMAGLGSSQRKKRTQEDVMLGVFQEPDSDEDSDSDEITTKRKRSRAANRDTSKNLSKPVSFVSKGIYTPDAKHSAEKDNEATPMEEDVPEEQVPIHPGIGMARKKSKREGAGYKGPAASNLTQMYGKGASIAMKMGFVLGRGLGKDDNEGIAEPIQVKVRRKNEGLAYGGSEMTEQMKKTRDEIIARQGAQVDPEEEKMEILTALPEEEKAWKKKKIKKEAPRVRYELEDYKPQISQPQVIVDMRGPQTKVIAATPSAGVSAGASLRDVILGPLPELQHNIRLLVDMSQASIDGIARKTQIEKERLQNLSREKEHIEDILFKQNSQISHLEKLIEIISKTAERLHANQIQLNILAKLFALLQDEYPEEYTSYNLGTLVITMVAPLLESYLKNWSPLTDPTYGVNEFKMWHSLLCKEQEEISLLVSKELRISDSAVYVQVVADVVLPKIRTSLASWRVRNFEPVISLLSAWQKVLPSMIYDNIVCQLIMPKLQLEVSQWNPRIDTMPVHIWLHPWLPIIDSKILEPLWAPIRHKLSGVLADWHPADPSAHMLLLPWKPVFDPVSLENLLVRCIVPKLCLAIRDLLVINPKQQFLDPFKWVLLWTDLVAEQHIIALLETEFFPKWSKALEAWLSSQSPDYDEISRWYVGWKGMFPTNLANNPRIRLYFTHALDSMTHALAGTPLPAFPAPPAQAHTVKNIIRTTPKSAEEDLSLREIVERFAESNDVLFVLTKRVWDGKQVFKFGKTNIVIDKELVYFEADNKTWHTVTLEELLEQNRTPPSGAASSANGID